MSDNKDYHQRGLKMNMNIHNIKSIEVGEIRKEKIKDRIFYHRPLIIRSDNCIFTIENFSDIKENLFVTNDEEIRENETGETPIYARDLKKESQVDSNLGVGFEEMLRKADKQDKELIVGYWCKNYSIEN